MWPDSLTIFTAISIHAPRVGSDPQHSARAAAAGDFYPRSPRGERPTLGAAPPAPQGISIHAPRVGSDNKTNFSRKVETDFYPRSPRGERQQAL